MALVLKDRVKETSVSTGTGDIALGGATGAYQAFSVIGNGNQTYYAIAGQTTNEWEVGIGTYVTSGNKITRDVVLASSNSNTIVTFSAGTKDVFITYPSEKAIYEEPNGETLINAGPITVIGAGVTTIPSLPAELGKFIGDVNSFAQIYTLNQNDGSTASADVITYNDLTTDGFTYFTDMGISSSNYTSVDYPIFTPNSGYIFHQGADFFIGNQTTNKDIKFFSGGVDVTDLIATFSGTDRSASFEAAVNIGGAIDVTGAATFGSTVLLDADPTLALQAATKQYVDSAVTAGIHIHEPVRVETTANLNGTYVQGGTTFNITTITSTTTVTTSVNHGLSVGDQIWLYTSAGNGLSTNTAYFVYSTPALNQLTLSLTYGGSQITGLTNATGLTYATRANSGIGATLTNAGTQAALNVDSIALSVGNRVMVRLQTNGAENGVYVVSTVGSGSTNWVLTRSADASFVSPSDPDGLGTGDYFYTQEGVLNAGDSHVLTTEPNTMIIGYTTLTYTQFSGSVDYVGGTNIDITGQVISLTGTVAATNGGTGTSTVATGDLLYGSATNTWSKLPVGTAYKSLVVNAGGTNVEWNAVALNQSAAISGALGPLNGGTGQSAYTLGDIIYSSATDTLAKLAGNTSTTKQYLSQTGTGSASAAPSWATISAADIGAGTLPAVRGGTGQSSYAIGDLLYADTTTTLAKLADVATGNVLISGGISAAPAWGKVALASAVSGTLPIANGGTNSTATPTAGGVAYGTGTAYAVNTAGTSGQYLTSGGAGAPTWTTLPTNVASISFGTTGLTPSTATTGAVTVAGTLGFANGGTSATTRQDAMDALAGAVTSGQYLRGNGTDVVMAAIVAGDVPTLNQNTTGYAAGIAGGLANRIAYQTAVNTTNFIAAPTTASTYLQWNGTAFAWATAGGSTNSFERYEFIATASQTTFTVGVTLSVIQVFVSGVLQKPTTDYTISGTNVVLTSGVPVGTIVSVQVFSTFSVANTYTQAETTNLINTAVPSQTGNSGKYLTTNGTSTSWAAASAFPSGTRMSFQQTSAPTGWTKDTTAAINDAILRLVTGTVSSGGATAFSVWNAQTATSPYILTTADIPSHTHAQQVSNGSATMSTTGTNIGASTAAGTVRTAAQFTQGNTGGGGGHSHGLTQNIKYYDFIIASKD